MFIYSDIHTIWPLRMILWSAAYKNLGLGSLFWVQSLVASLNSSMALGNYVIRPPRTSWWKDERPFRNTCNIAGAL